MSIGLETARTWPRALLTGAAVVALYVALTLIMTYPQAKVLSRGVSSELADPLFSTWRLAWVAHQLPRDPSRLFDTNIFHPERATLAYSDAMLVPALVAAPLIWLGVHQVLVYNILLLSGFALSGAAMFLLVRALTRHAGAALVAGFIFAFLPYRFSHYAHLELQMTLWMPLCLWALHRTVTTGRYRDGALTGVLIALQTLSSVYYGIFFATYLLPVATMLLLSRRRAGLWPISRSLCAGGVIAAVLVLPILRPYLAARRAVGERPGEMVYFYSATPADYLAAPPQNIMLGQRGAEASERHLFQGVFVPLVAAASLWPPISAARLGYTAGLLLAFDLSLGIKGVGYGRLRQHALPYRGLRVPARMSILVGLSLSILSGFALAQICRRLRSGPARVATLGTVLLLIYVEYRSTPVLVEVWNKPPDVYAAIADQPDALVLDLPLIAPDVALEPTFVYFSTFHWHPLVNGYSGFSPPSYKDLPRIMATFPDDASIAEIRRRGVKYVVVHGTFYTPERYRSITVELRNSPDFDLKKVAVWQTLETSLYSVVQ